MDIVDKELSSAEQDLYRERKNPLAPPADRPVRHGAANASSSSSSASSASIIREEIGTGAGSGLSTTNTRRDLELHPTALSRIETHRTQHSTTVGKTTTSRQSKKPLPGFGGGKDYPPPLPDKEDYVVEFDGHDDPLHPQNWPIKKK